MTHRPRVLAAYDGTRRSRLAVDWAITQSAERGWPLVISMAQEQPVNTHVTSGPGTPPGAAVDSAEWSHLRDIGRRAQTLLGDTPVATRYVLRRALTHLTEESRAPGLVVIGTRGLGRLRARLYGGVADRLAGRAKGPVVVVPSEANMEGPVTIGVAGATAQPALRWAVAEARRRQAPLRIVHCWFPHPPLPLSTAAAVLPQSPAALAAAREGHDALVDNVAAAAPDVQVEGVFRHGDAATELQLESKQSGLLVVGSRRRSGLGRLLLGSTSRRVLRDTRCPTVVVPDDVAEGLVLAS